MKKRLIWLLFITILFIGFAHKHALASQIIVNLPKDITPMIKLPDTQSSTKTSTVDPTITPAVPTPTHEVTTTPTITPIVTDIPTPTPSITPEVTSPPTLPPSVTPEATGSPTPTPSVTPEVTSPPTLPPSVTPEATGSPTPTPSVTPEASGSPTPTSSLTPTPTTIAIPTKTPTKVPTKVPTITPTPVPMKAIYSISISPTGSKSFQSQPKIYTTQETHTVTITNTGNKELSLLKISLRGSDATSFVLDKVTIRNLAVGASERITVKPKLNLAKGYYSASVQISGSKIVTKEFYVNITIKDIPIQPDYDPAKSYFTSINTTKFTELLSAAKKGNIEPFLIYFYNTKKTTHNPNPANATAQVKEYANGYGVHIYAMNNDEVSKSESPTTVYKKYVGKNVSFPTIIFYDGTKIHTKALLFNNSITNFENTLRVWGFYSKYINVYPQEKNTNPNSGTPGNGSTTPQKTTVKILSYPTKIKYFKGDRFDPNGVKVILMKDGKETNISDKITYHIQKINGVKLTKERKFTTTGKKKVELRYKNKKIGTYTITVSLYTPNSSVLKLKNNEIKIIGYPSKKLYLKGEGFKTSGINVIMNQNGKNVNITAKVSFYTSKVVELTNGRKFTVRGDKQVEIRYNDKKIGTFKITVY